VNLKAWVKTFRAWVGYWTRNLEPHQTLKDDARAQKFIFVDEPKSFLFWGWTANVGD